MSPKMGFYVLKTNDQDGMSTKLLPILDVVVTLITHGDQILAVYNDKWSSFTLPTTKRRSWEDSNAAKGSVREEEWEDAAVRAAAEWLRGTTTAKPVPAGDLPEFQQSDRDGKWKRYHLKAFILEVESLDAIRPTAHTQWLTAEQFLDETRRPISPTARHAIAELQLARKI